MIVLHQQYKQLIQDLFNDKKQAIAYNLAQRIDLHLTRQTFHFHRRGELLTKFDDVIRAILAGELDEETIPENYITVPGWMVK